ncbi:MAG TPA: nickel-dependent lactate racemase [Verrucomicrobiae bacterium]|nr:nickel-dependent lactate racemase [Verrucomicrobiae bacterium]
MRLTMAFGRDGVGLDLPDDPRLTVLEGRDAAPLAEPAAAIERSITEPIGSRPLGEIARGRRDACIVISDVTRPVPNKLILPPILKALESAGVPRAKITILIATGLHRPNEGEELVGLVGAEIATAYRCENHFAQRPESIVRVGETRSGIPVELCRRYVEADLKILTGFIEPHMWAGYSGGRKAILPGIASAHTMSFMHGFKMVADPGCGYDELKHNPFHRAGIEVAEMVGVDFICNVTLDARKRVTGVFSGHFEKAHEAGCEFLRPQAVVEVDSPFDAVITSGGGAPLDVSLYQTAKGITGAADVLRDGGEVLICSECGEGLGGREFTELTLSAKSPQEFLERLQRPGFYVVDQWGAQEIYAVMTRVRVALHSKGISADETRRCHIEPIADFPKAVRDLLGRLGASARIGVIPRGPFTIGRVRREMRDAA